MLSLFEDSLLLVNSNNLDLILDDKRGLADHDDDDEYEYRKEVIHATTSHNVVSQYDNNQTQLFSQGQNDRYAFFYGNSKGFTKYGRESM
jgi:hypothetical protein